ncbi:MULTISPECIES: ABC transporter ATP-binding protein [unclassified Massilia]|uniref:ABC transporter ATP-binding protein n=1 Tax=unclassified Massilia TaxID=2609279 RepID=UPI001B8435A2|nr:MULTISPECIES: ABC transporter ATP-binding protein [unclassified Massilia]MBQ5940990.1 ABC transporter ATP-binding protein [Massilia sp. AB1]MBQ5963780.1 ABC transporter ATP-binding protein [Massilia sp. ZL223]
MSQGAPLIRLEGITKHYQMGGETIAALAGIDLQVARNDYVAFIGSSGSGKSTMMNILGCLDTPTSGRYFLNGRDVAGMSDAELARTRNEEIGFIFQSFNLLTRATAVQNVMQPLIYRGVRPADRLRRATEAMARVGLEHRLDHLPNQLSGGQRQRVAIARALCSEPSILLADEPTGNLDSSTAADIMSLFDTLHAEGQTVIIVTHEPDIAAHCGRTVRLADGRVQSDTVNAERSSFRPRGAAHV